MKIYVNGIEKELVAKDIVSGGEWTQDLLVGYDTLHYDEDNEEYVMSESDFNWWSKIINKLNQITDIVENLAPDQLEKYESEKEHFNYTDLEDEVNAKLDFLGTL